MTIELTEVASGYSTGVINSNFEAIEAYINDNLLNRDGTTAGEVNQLELDIDVNNHRLFNLPLPINSHEAARLIDVQNAIEGDTAANLISFTPTAPYTSDTVQGAIEETQFVDTSTGIDEVLLTALDKRIVYRDTVADMLALDTAELLDGQQILVKEYNIGTEIGGGGFFWDASSTATDNGGTVFQVSGVSTGRWRRIFKGFVTPDIFGATGDGVADDSAAISAARAEAIANGSGTMKLENNRSYNYTSPIVISEADGFHNIVSDSNTYLSPSKPKLIYSGADGTWAIETDTTDTDPTLLGASHCELRGFVVEPAGTRVKNGIDARRMRHSTIIGVDVTNCDKGIRYENSWSNGVRDSRVRDCNRAVEFVTTANAIDFYNTQLVTSGVALRCAAGVRSLNYFGGSVEGNTTGLRFDSGIFYSGTFATYFENNASHIAWQGAATTRGLILSSCYIENGPITEDFLKIDTTGLATIMIVGGSIEAQPSAGVDPKMVRRLSGTPKVTIDNLSLNNGATFDGSGDVWKQGGRFGGNWTTRAWSEFDITPTLGSGWTNFDTNNPLIYWRDLNGNVRIVGVINGGTVGAGNTIFTLNASFRPRQSVNHPLPTFDGSSWASNGVLRVQSGGAVDLIVGDNSRVPIDITFEPDQ